jgi:dinuclear metal center YbgI/SA1388 family protein
MRRATMSGSALSELVLKLKQWAPLERAESWDNVGLLIEPTTARAVHRVLLTNDLTSRVVAEAVERDVQLVVTYHPVLFAATKRLDARTQHVALRCAEERIAVYSPHTAVDAKAGGVNDWLLAALASRANGDVVRPLTRSQLAGASQVKLVTFLPADALERVRSALADAGAGRIGEYDLCSFAHAGRGSFRGSARSNPTVGTAGQLEHVDELRLEMLCPKSCLPAILDALRASHPYETPAFDLVALADVPLADTGMGRFAQLKQRISLDDALARVKQHLGLPHVRVARSLKRGNGGDGSIGSVAVCAGSGGSLLRGNNADLWITGELSHHEALAACEAGVNVILCEHSNTERGYIRATMRNELQALFGKEVEVMMSETDRDPIEIV